MKIAFIVIIVAVIIVAWIAWEVARAEKGDTE